MVVSKLPAHSLAVVLGRATSVSLQLRLTAVAGRNVVSSCSVFLFMHYSCSASSKTFAGFLQSGLRDGFSLETPFPAFCYIEIQPYLIPLNDKNNETF